MAGGPPLVGIVAAAGSGERLGSGEPKAFVPCGGRPMLEWSVEALGAICDRVVVVVPVSLAEGTDRVAGGATRSESVRAGVLASPDAGAYVVQDAARPLVTAELVRRCAAALAEGWDGAIAAAPATDTIKEASAADARVERTLDRSLLWAVQTPQAFGGEILRRALDVGDSVLAAATDDAALVEAAGGLVKVIEVSEPNLKVTGPADLELAEFILRRRGPA